MDDFIFTQASLSKTFCSKLIAEFDKKCSEVSSFNISAKQDWATYDSVLFAKLSKSVEKYFTQLSKKKKNYRPLSSSKTRDTGYTIQKFPEQKEKMPRLWAYDKGAVFTYMWFLNEGGDLGYVEFSSGVKIAPKVGHIVVFPSVWTLTYDLVPPKSSPRYMCLGNIVET